MFIDYVTLMLVNMTAGFFVLSYYVYKGAVSAEQHSWAPAFAISGIIAVVTGFHMCFNWPLPGSYNVAYSEMSILLGMLFLGTAWALAKGWNLHILAVYAFFAGLAAVLIGIRFIHLGLSNTPIVAGIGFILPGVAGMCACPYLYIKENRTIRLTGAIVLVAAALIWAQIGYGAYWHHLASLSKWVAP